MKLWTEFQPTNLGDWYQWGYETAVAGYTKREYGDVYQKCSENYEKTKLAWAAYSSGYEQGLAK